MTVLWEKKMKMSRYWRGKFSSAWEEKWKNKEIEQQNNSTYGCLSIMLSLFWVCLYLDCLGTSYHAGNIPKSLFTKRLSLTGKRGGHRVGAEWWTWSWWPSTSKQRDVHRKDWAPATYECKGNSIRPRWCWGPYWGCCWEHLGHSHKSA